MTDEKKPLVDAEERELIRTALDRNVIVEAAAGTGKTTELVNRIVAVLAAGETRVDQIVAVTFTEKAAGELKLRLRGGLELARREATSGSVEHERLEAALARLEEARVGTIHGFCADLLRERSVDAGVDPKFQTMTEGESESLFGETFHLWLQGQLEDPPEGIRRSLRRSSRDGPVERLRLAAWTLAEWRDFREPWRRDPFDREARIDELVEKLHSFAALTEQATRKDRDNLYRDTERARTLSREIRIGEEVRDRDYDGLEASLADLADRRFARVRKGSGSQYGEGILREHVLGSHRKLVEELQLFAEEADADLAALLQRELLESVERYQERKRASGRLDFVDLLLSARDLVRDSEDVRAGFQRQFRRLFVDEFQDTDPLQAEILLLLSSLDPSAADWRKVDPVPGKLFVVADPKQSIYRFRRADVGIYEEVKRLLVAGGALELHLSTSFRAVPEIQSLVNAVFPEYMDGDEDAHQARYVPLSPQREGVTGQPSVVALPIPEPYGSYRVTKGAIEESLPDAVGAFVEWLVKESGWTVEERGERVPISPRHVCLLFRRFDSFFAGDVTRPYVQALESRGVRHLLVGGRSFHEREEVETLRTALTAIEWPDDELSVFAALRGSLFAIGDEELMEYRSHGMPEGKQRAVHPFRIPAELSARLEPIAGALELLADLHRGRNRRPIADTINVLLERTRAHAGFALRPSGEQVLANVLHLAEQARNYESTGGISFRGFVERLLQDAEHRKAAEAPILEEGSEGVRLMTVHKAKGLEFPIVVLADPTADIARARAGRAIETKEGRKPLCAIRIAGWAPAELRDHQAEEVKRDVAEGVRIAYVAATRARDLLVIPGVGDGPWGGTPGEDLRASSGWLAPLNGGIYPSRKTWGQPARGADRGLPELGRDSVLSRPHDLEFSFDCVNPGLHAFTESGYDVAWWDPRALRLGVEPLFGVRQAELMSKDADPARVAADARRFEEWREARDDVIAEAAEPGLRVRSATDRASLLARSAGPDVEVQEVARDAVRPAGPRFGALVHAVLSTVPLGSDPEAVRANAELQGRILGALEDEIAAAGSAVAKVLEHPLLARAREAAERGECRRETPVTASEEDGSLTDGIVDLAFREDGKWTVVDFKTDRELERGARRLPSPGRLVRRDRRAGHGRGGRGRPPPRLGGRVKRVVFSVATIVLGLATGLLLLEIVLRIAGVDPMGEFTVGRDVLLRESDDPELAYELRPGAEGVAWRTPIRINSAGFRDREYEREKPPGTTRIAFLGDSITFGNSLHPEERFTDRLEARYREDGRPVDVLNLGVGGYSTLEEVVFFERVGLPFDPDLAVLVYCLNDAGVHSSNLTVIRAIEGYGEWIRRSRLLQVLLVRIDEKMLTREMHAANRDPEFRRRFQGRIEPVEDDRELLAKIRELRSYLDRNEIEPPVRFLEWHTSRAKIGKLRHSLSRLRGLSQAHGFPVAMIVVPFLDERGHPEAFRLAYDIVRHEADRAGFPVLEVYDALAAEGLADLQISEGDRKNPVHPNARGHALLADRLYEGLAELGLTP